MSESRELLFLRDLCNLLKDLAIRAKKEADAASSEDRSFALGRLMGLHEVISLVQQQSEVFGIDLKDIGLDDITPEKDLL